MKLTLCIVSVVLLIGAGWCLGHLTTKRPVLNITVVEDKPSSPSTSAAPTLASADTRSGGIASTDLPASTVRHGNATAPVTAQPKPSPMLTELQRHFSKWEAEQLEALYLDARKDVELYALPAELRERMPAPATTVADVRQKAIDILGQTGFNLLMELSAPPPDIKPNTDEMVEYVLSNPPLIWWSQLRD